MKESMFRYLSTLPKLLSRRVGNSSNSGEDYRYKAANRYLDISRTTASRTGPIAILWLVAIMVTWLAIEEGIDSEHTKKIIETYSNASAELHYFKEKLATEENTKDNLLAKEDAKKDAKKNFDIVKVEKVEFKLPTFPSFKISTKFAPALLGVIILTLALYLTLMRERAYRYLGNALRILRVDLNIPMKNIGDALGPRTWWITPLPRKSDGLVSTDDFAMALGWHSPLQANALWIGIFWFVMIGIQLRLTYIGFDYIGEFAKYNLIEKAFSNQFVFFIQAIYIVLFGTTASLGIWWLKPGNVPDRLLDPRAEMRVARRQFLVHLGSGCMVAFLVNKPTLYALKSISMPILGLNPRFKRRRSNPRSNVLQTKSRGLHINQKTKIAHYILDSGQLLGVSMINEKNLVPVKFKDLMPPPYYPRAHITRASATFELTALKYIKNQDHKSACDALMAGIQYNKIKNKEPDFRLYDLLAGLSVRYNLPYYLNELREILETFAKDGLIRRSKARKHRSPLLQFSQKIKKNLDKHVSEIAISSRLSKWQDSNSKWHKKWTDKSKEIIWRALPMQDPHTVGNGRSSRPRAIPYCVLV